MKDLNWNSDYCTNGREIGVAHLSSLTLHSLHESIKVVIGFFLTVLLSTDSFDCTWTGSQCTCDVS